MRGSGRFSDENAVTPRSFCAVQSFVGHLNQILVKPGDRVSQGSAIGLEGSTGNSTGPHVHFEVRVNGTPVDPVSYLPSGAPSQSRA